MRSSTWAEAYRPTTGTALVTYDDGPFAGQAAVVRNGNAISIGAWSASLITEVLTGICAEAGDSVSLRCPKAFASAGAAPAKSG